MPGRLACDEAIMFASSRLKVQDPELKQGKVETVTVQTSAGSIDQPWGREGGFAVVYKFRTCSGGMRAVRCFRVPMNPDTEFRYERISKYFHQYVREVTAGFKYHAHGINIREQGQPSDIVYPIVEMDWIEGVTLNEKVDELCKARDQAGLKDLADQWLQILTTMRQAKIAHGDLAGGNVMVRTNGRLVLVDYDGVYIPDFAGMPGVVLGQESYQHPQMKMRQFNEHMDNFSALVIYTALVTLQMQPALWDKHIKRNAKGKPLDTNLLFTKEDFQNPDTSLLFADLERIPDSQIKMLVKELKNACQQPIHQARSPLDLDPEKMAFDQLEQAIQKDEDEQIVKLGAILANYGPAKRYTQRVQLAQLRMKAIQQFRNALATKNAKQIVSSYDSILDYSSSITKEERERFKIASSFVQACNTNDDDNLLMAFDMMQNMHFIFTPEETLLIDTARKRKNALQIIRDALKTKNARKIVETYDATLNYKNLTEQELEQIVLALKVIAAFKSDDDHDLVSIYDEIKNFNYADKFIFTPQEEQRFQLAQQRKAALIKLQWALNNKRIQQIADAYDPILDNYAKISQKEHDQLHLARNFTQAYRDDDDQAIAVLYNEIQNFSYRNDFTFTAQEKQRIELAQQRKTALVKFLWALSNKRPQQIIDSYDSLLEGSKNFTPEDRELFILAWDFVQAYKNDDDLALVEVYEKIRTPQYRKLLLFSTQEEQRIALAEQRKVALLRFQTGLSAHSKKAQEIVSLYDPILDNCKNVRREERKKLEQAQAFMKMYNLTIEAIQANNNTGDNNRIRDAYDEALASEFDDFTPPQRNRIQVALTHIQLEDALNNKAYGYALRLARDIEMMYQVPIVDYRLSTARKMYIKHLDPTVLEAYFEGEEVCVKWQWPNDDLIQHTAVVWSVYDWPQITKPGTSVVHVQRGIYDRQGMFRLKVGRQVHIYIQVLTAMIDFSDYPQDPKWYYSRGFEPGSKKLVHALTN